MRVLIPILAIAIIAAFFIGSELNTEIVYIEEEQKPVKFVTGEGLSTSILVPAVDEDGEGVVTKIDVMIKEGTGKILTNIEGILVFVDTQNSIRTACNVAGDVAGFDLSETDIIYTVTADAAVIEGPSAGAAITVATVAALTEQELDPTVMITGTIHPDGRIGSVGEVTEKALTSKEIGAELFLVPRGSELPSSFNYERVTECEFRNGLEYCESHYEKSQANGIGIDIMEVGNIQDALEYFGIDV